MASLHVHTEPITVRTAGKGTYEITNQISEVLTCSGIVAGTLTVLVRHTSCSLIIMENADPTARRDLEKFSIGSCPKTRLTSSTTMKDRTTCRRTSGCHLATIT